MNTSLKRLPKSRIELTVEVTPAEMVPFFESAYQELGSQVEIQGFRKGKAPKTLILERVGQERLTAAALDLALPRTYHQAVMNEEVVPVAEPTVHIDAVSETGPFRYRAEVDVLPSVETGNYRKLQVDRKKFAPKPITETAITEALDRLRKAAATPKEVLRPAQVGDLIDISYLGRVGEVVQEGLDSQHHPLILGDKTLLPAFEDQLVGLSAGENKKFTIEVPKAGNQAQPVDFEVTLNKVSELVLPELDDQLAQRFGKQTAAEVKAAITEELTTDAQRAADDALEAAILEAITKQARLELPESLIDREVGHRIEQFEEQVKRAGQSFETFLAHRKKTLEEFRADLRPAATEAVKAGLVLRAIAESEQLVDTKATNEQDTTPRKVLDFLRDQLG